MDITSDLAALQRRISEITGQSTVLPGAAAVGLTPDASASGSNFSSLLASALNQSPGASAPGAPDAVTADAGAANAPAMVPPQQIESLVSANSAAWGVDPALVKAIIANESGFDANATSKTGAQGLMQLEPETASGLGVSNAYDPAQNVWGGTRYIRGLLDRFHGDMRLAVAAYNAGPGAVEKYNGVPPYAETQSYVQNVLASYQKYKAQPLQP